MTYYQCIYCKFSLPKENYNYLDHSCFADIDVNKEDLCVNTCNELFRCEYIKLIPIIEELEIFGRVI